MMAQERDWIMQVHRQAMEIMGVCGLLDLEAPDGSKEKARGKLAALKALALAQEALNRIHAAGMAADQGELQESGYDLATLTTTAPSRVTEEPSMLPDVSFRHPQQQEAVGQPPNATYQEMAKMEILLSIPQAAKRLGITRSAVHYAIQAQKLLAQRVGTRWILHAEDVDAYRVRKGYTTSDRQRKASQSNMVLATAAWVRARGQKNVASEQSDKE